MEYLLVVLLCAAIAWLVCQHLTLGKQVAMLESTVSQLRIPNPNGLEESVSQMIDELKAATDNACNEVAQQIDALRRAEENLEQEPIELPNAAVIGKSNAVALIVQLADEGLSALDIARKARVGTAEVELALRFRRHRAVGSISIRRMEPAIQFACKEVAVA